MFWKICSISKRTVMDPAMSVLYYLYFLQLLLNCLYNSTFTSSSVLFSSFSCFSSVLTCFKAFHQFIRTRRSLRPSTLMSLQHSLISAVVRGWSAISGSSSTICEATTVWKEYAEETNAAGKRIWQKKNYSNPLQH